MWKFRNALIFSPVQNKFQILEILLKHLPFFRCLWLSKQLGWKSYSGSERWETRWGGLKDQLHLTDAAHIPHYSQWCSVNNFISSFWTIRNTIHSNKIKKKKRKEKLLEQIILKEELTFWYHLIYSAWHNCGHCGRSWRQLTAVLRLLNDRVSHWSKYWVCSWLVG